MTNLHLQKLTMKKKQLRHATIIDLNLKEPGNTGSQGLHKAMERAIESSSFKFSQFKGKLKLPPTQPTLIVPYVCYRKKQLVTIQCLHRVCKLQLALKYAFKEKKAAIEEQEQLPSEFCPFKKATFKIAIVPKVPGKITDQRSTLLKASVGYQKDDTSTSCY